MQKLILYYNTIRYLKPIQIYYRIYYIIRNGIRKPNLAIPSEKKIYQYSLFSLKPGLETPESYNNGNFTFLNQTVKISTSPFQSIDKEIRLSKLWIYNLYYFDYLLQPNMTREKGQELILDFIHFSETHTIGLNPYPTSLRILNWITFISRYSIVDHIIITSLHDQCNLLFKNIEYHLLGNHILENGFALFTAGLFFNDLSFYKKGKHLLSSQLNEQILTDGGHFELSPMYHAIVLHRLLNLINILQQNPTTNQELLPLLRKNASYMIFWINEMTFLSDNIPLFNDAANRITPKTSQLIDYARKLNLPIQKPDGYCLSSSGYRKYHSGRYEIIIDAGVVGPQYIPGHAHADMLSFEMYVEEKPFIVDSGTSTYLPGTIRSYERSTLAHNTVAIGSIDQSEMWGSHRVGRRAKCKILSDKPNEFCATVIGFPPLDSTHKRTFLFNEDHIEIHDIITNRKTLNGIASFHFPPDIISEITDNQVKNNYGILSFDGHESIEIRKFNFAPEFNKTIPSSVLRVNFTKYLKTKIQLNNKK